MMNRAKGMFILKGMLLGLIFLGMSLWLFSCKGEKAVALTLAVKNQENGSGIPGAKVELHRFYEGGRPVLLDSLQCDENGFISPLKIKFEKGYTYQLTASKAFFEAALSGNGASRANEIRLKPSELPSDTIQLFLRAMEATTPTLDRKEQGTYHVNELIGSLKAGNWSGNFIPRLSWGDIPALLEAGGDTTVIHHFPIKTGSAMHPDSARLGQVMLWMVEAIRRDVSRRAGDKPVFLMPPSDVPVLGTRRGNPRLFNSKGALERAYRSYQNWWESGSAEDTLRKARQNPLRGTGLGWM